MTRAQRKSIDRLKKRGPVAVLHDRPDELRIAWLNPDLAEDERERVIRPSGLVEEPADIEGLR